MFTRRRFLISSAMLAAGIAWPKLRANASSQMSAGHRRAKALKSVDPAVGRKSPIAGGTLDPTTITKYVDSLIIPPAMPKAGVVNGQNGEEIDYYEIAVRQFTQQILPASDNFAKTTVWSYGSAVASHGNTFNYPAFTIEGQVDRPVRVKWINDLKDENGNYLPHILPVDQTLHWANPGGGEDMRDDFGSDPAPYSGPVPMITHVHGAHTYEDSDGYAEAWYLPAANNIPAGFAKNGTFYNDFKQKAEARQGQAWEPGTSVFDYPNNQRATTIWYHDHALGMTRNNVYAGPAGFYILRGGRDDLQDGSLPAGDFEIPIAIQDRSFDVVAPQSGPKQPSLFYPATRDFFDGFTGPFIPDPKSDMHPIWNPEFFGNTMVVNGRTWPKLQVQRRRYRFRFLNGCNSRFIILKMVASNPNDAEFVYPEKGALPFWQVGAEGGFLDAPVPLDHMLMSPAERADVIIDFSKVPLNVSSIYVINEGPDEPFGGGRPGTEFARAHIGTTGQVMRFDLVPAVGQDTTVDPAVLKLPVRKELPPTQIIRRVALLEMDSELLRDPEGEPVGPREAVLGVVEKNLFGNPIFVEKMWKDEVTETPLAGDTEIWEIFNITADAHPIHIHQVMFEVVNREDRRTGEIRPPELTEHGYKDTVIAYPDQITRIRARFDIPGLFVWHCHIVEHEDNEMMRPFRVMHRIHMPVIGA